MVDRISLMARCYKHEIVHLCMNTICVIAVCLSFNEQMAWLRENAIAGPHLHALLVAGTPMFLGLSVED